MALLMTISACALTDEGPNVVVLQGSDLTLPPDAPPAEEPSARLLPGSGGVVFVSAPLYSGSCPPTAEAARDGNELVLTIERGDSGDCTADANPYTFVIEAGETGPERLVVRQEGNEDIELDLRTAPQVGS